MSCILLRFMDKDTKKFAMTIGIFAIVICAGYASLVAYTGYTLPFSSVVSESMQHDNNRSSLGVIDTGDIVIVRDTSKADIQTYVEGYHTGYSTFENYGSVIIYERENHNPVIHRAILWMDYNSDGTWSSRELSNLPTGSWYYVYTDSEGKKVVGNDYMTIRGILYFTDDIIYGKNPYVDMDSLEKSSGYLTMGDNPTSNPNFDQSIGIMNHLIATDEIKSVAAFEIPWMGVPKLLLRENNNLDHVPNSLPSLMMGIITLFSLLIIIDIISIYRYNKAGMNRIEEENKWKRF